MNDENKSDKKKQHKDFDRIFRENAVPVFLPLIEMQLGFNIKSFKVLSTTLPKTSDRDVDALYEIEDEWYKGNFALRISIEKRWDDVRAYCRISRNDLPHT